MKVKVCKLSSAKKLEDENESKKQKDGDGKK